MKDMVHKPKLMLYCQHSLGMGHLMRSFNLTKAINEYFDVVFLNGGPVPEGVPIPLGVEMVNLPPLGMDSDGKLVSRSENYSVAQAKDERQRMLLTALERISPAVILIELFPFGRKKFADELLPVLDVARKGQRSDPLILCSLRDLLVSSRDNQQRHDDRVARLVNTYFDGVLVHSDPKFARLEESFHPQGPLEKPIYYSGFVLPEQRPTGSVNRTRRVVASAGGGMVGAPLLRTAADAHTLLWEQERMPMTLIAGPFFPESDWRELRGVTQEREGIELFRSVDDLGAELGNAVASVSQCGYNTCMDILRARVPALVVPFSEGQENEQMRRAQRLADLNLVQILPPAQLERESLATAIRALLRFHPDPCGLDLDGAQNSARIIRKLSDARGAGTDNVGAVQIEQRYG